MQLHITTSTSAQPSMEKLPFLMSLMLMKENQPQPFQKKTCHRELYS
jgi:hypothetical protein